MKTLKLPNTHPNPINIHTLHPYAHNPLPQVSRDNSGQQQTPTETNRHQETVPGTPKGWSRMCGGSCWHWMAFAGACWCLLVPDGVFLVSYGVWRWEEGVWGFTQSVYECCLWTCVRVSLRLRVYMSVLALYGAANALIGKAPKGKIPCTWHFWNIKIPKPPYISSLKIIELIHFLEILGPSEEIYNLQSLWITLYMIWPITVENDRRGEEEKKKKKSKKSRIGLHHISANKFQLK